MKSKSLMLLLVSGVFGLFAAVMISQVIGSGGESAPEISMGPVLVAIEQLDHDALLTEENVKIENWPTEIIPENAVRSFEQIENMAIVTRLSGGLPILIDDLIPKNQRRVISIPEGFKVVSMKASAADTNGLVSPGDRVDIVGIFKVKKKDQLVTTSKTFLKKITVFAIDSRIRRESGDGAGNGAGNAIVSLLLNEAQAEQFILVEKEAHLKLVLRGNELGSYEEPDANAQELVDLSDVFDPEGEPEDVDGPATQITKVRENQNMRVWNGASFEDFGFAAGRLEQSPQAVSTSAPEPAVSKIEDDDDYAGIDEEDADFEQDQYPGE